MSMMNENSGSPDFCPLASSLDTNNFSNNSQFRIIKLLSTCLALRRTSTQFINGWKRTKGTTSPTRYKYDLGLIRPGVSTSSLMFTTHTMVALRFAALFPHGTLVTTAEF